MKEIEFIESSHKYIRKEKQYISVTTLLHEFMPKFDWEYWSTYKAIKDTLENQGIWNTYKFGAGGWEEVVPYYLENSAPFKDRIESRKQWYIDKWENEGRIAREKGTKVHKELEDTVNEKGIIDKGEHLPSFTGSITDPLSDKPDKAVITEVIVYNDEFELAGMVDKIVKKGKTLIIRDHKTSKEITKEAFREATMFPPLQHLPHANFYEYSLQLSTYAWMLEQFGYKIDSLVIEHRNRETGKLITNYEALYLKKEVIDLLNEYRKSK